MPIDEDMAIGQLIRILPIDEDIANWWGYGQLIRILPIDEDIANWGEYGQLIKKMPNSLIKNNQPAFITYVQYCTILSSKENKSRYTKYFFIFLSFFPFRLNI